MRKSLFLLVGTLVAASALTASPAQAALVTIDQIIYQSGIGVNPAGFSGTLNITVTGAQQLTIVMTNTSLDSAVTNSALPASMLLTGFGLQLGSVDIITASTVTVTGGSTALNFDAGQSALDITNQYAYANGVIDGYGQTGVLAVDSIVSSVNNGGATRFGGASVPITINGPGYGALSALETQYGSSTPAVRSSITFVLNLSGAAPSVAAIDSGNVVLAFGSPDSVPDGGATGMALGIVMLGLGVVRRFFRR
jgi:hypothetical protein